MSAKDLFFDFIYLVFLLLLVGFCIFFFIAGDRFKTFTVLLKSLMPLAIVGIIFIIKIKINRRELKKRKSEENLEIILHLTFMDKMYSDILNYSAPIAILIIPIIIQRRVDIIDIFQALATFAIFYFWQKKLFSKE